jgi:hypothetical protein
MFPFSTQKQSRRGFHEPRDAGARVRPLTASLAPLDVEGERLCVRIAATSVRTFGTQARSPAEDQMEALLRQLGAPPDAVIPRMPNASYKNIRA